MEEEEEDDDDPQCLAQTILEIDYQTIIDDGDDVDEFCVFKDTLQGMCTLQWVLLPKKKIAYLKCCAVRGLHIFCYC